jgi:hypothetical protein
VIAVAVRWYLRYNLSYRDVEELLVEHGVEVDHVSVFRWVQRFTPMLADTARFARHLPGDQWFVDVDAAQYFGRVAHPPGEAAGWLAGSDPLQIERGGHLVVVEPGDHRVDRGAVADTGDDLPDDGGGVRVDLEPVAAGDLFDRPVPYGVKPPRWRPVLTR